MLRLIGKEPEKVRKLILSIRDMVVEFEIVYTGGHHVAESSQVETNFLEYTYSDSTELIVL